MSDHDDHNKKTGPFYLTQKALAKRWDLGTRALEQMRYQGRGPKYLKICNRVRYPLDEVEKYEREHLFSNTTQY
jgi:hypothetical protein